MHALVESLSEQFPLFFIVFTALSSPSTCLACPFFTKQFHPSTRAPSFGRALRLLSKAFSEPSRHLLLQRQPSKKSIQGLFEGWHSVGHHLHLQLLPIRLTKCISRRLNFICSQTCLRTSACDIPFSEVPKRIGSASDIINTRDIAEQMPPPVLLGEIFEEELKQYNESVHLEKSRLDI